MKQLLKDIADMFLSILETYGAKISRAIFHWTWRVQVHRKYYRKKK